MARRWKAWVGNRRFLILLAGILVVLCAAAAVAAVTWWGAWGDRAEDKTSPILVDTPTAGGETTRVSASFQAGIA